MRCLRTGAVAALTLLTAVPATAAELTQFRAPSFTLDASSIAEDLVAHYPFDETAGTAVNDRSGNGRHAAIVNSNANTIWNNGRGLTLPGGNGGTAPAVRLPDSLLAGLSNVTIAYDVRLSSTTQQGPGLRVRPDGGQRRLPRRDAGRRHHPPPGVDRGAGREPGGPDGRRTGGAGRRTRGSTWP